MGFKHIGVTTWPSRITSRDVSHVTIPFPLLVGHFLLVVLGTNSNGYQDIQWWMWRNGWHDLKRFL